MATFPVPVANNRQRDPITLYRVADDTSPTNVVFANPNEWVNITDQLAPALLTKEVGFALDASLGAGQERVISQFSGPVRARVAIRLTGGIVAQTTYLGLFVNGDFSAPLALAALPTDQRDVASQDGVELLQLSWLLESAQGADPTTGITGTVFQVALAVSQATTLSYLGLELELHRLLGANVGA